MVIVRATGRTRRELGDGQNQPLAILSGVFSRIERLISKFSAPGAVGRSRVRIGRSAITAAVEARRGLSLTDLHCYAVPKLWFQCVRTLRRSDG